MKIDTHKFLYLVRSIVILSILACSACASPRLVTTGSLEPVGPEPAGIHPQGPMTGYLKVYSVTREYWNGDTLYYPHRRYSLYNADGSLNQVVDNRSSRKDESPREVPLPVGRYYVISESEVDGLVKVPVVIKGGALTVVNLEPGRPSDNDTQEIQPSRAVKAPSGQVVGWRAGS